MWIKVDSVWQQVQEGFIKINGTWEKIKKTYTKINGDWKEVWSHVLKMVQGVMIGNSSYTVNLDHIELYATTSGGHNNSISTCVTDISVDLSNVLEVRIEWSGRGSSTSFADGIIVVSTEKYGGGNTYDVRYYTNKTFGKRIDTLDVSNLGGNHYIRVHAVTGHYSGRWYRVKFYRLWLDNKLIYDVSST